MFEKCTWPASIADIPVKPVRKLVEEFYANARQHVHLLGTYAQDHGNPFSFFRQDILLRMQDDGNYEDNGNTPAPGTELIAVVVYTLIPTGVKAEWHEWYYSSFSHHLAFSVRVRWRNRDIRIDANSYPSCNVYGAGHEKGRRVEYHPYGHTLHLKAEDYVTAAKYCEEVAKHEAAKRWFQSKIES